MKRLFLAFLLFSQVSYGQYSNLTIIPEDNSFITSFENLDNSNWGFYMGGYINFLTTYQPYYPNSYNSYYLYPNRIGFDYGILGCGIVLGIGGKMDLNSSENPLFYPDFMVKFQILKLLTQNKDIWDISLSYHTSDKTYVGFGLSIPFRYGNYYR